jgi:hypothetical protein
MLAGPLDADECRFAATGGNDCNRSKGLEVDSDNFITYKT